jgi:hypothetical protein
MMDMDSSAASTTRFAGCLRVVPLLQTLKVGSNTRPTPRRYTVSTARRRDSLECTCCPKGESAQFVSRGKTVLQYKSIAELIY